MSSRSKRTPLEAFELNVADARHLLDRVEVFTNQRKRRPRRELRDRLGESLRIAKRSWDEIDGLESDDAFVVFKPGARLGRDDFLNHAPLLRQAIVAACAAFETFVADLVMAQIGSQITSGELTKKARQIPLTLETWMTIHDSYEHKKRGLRSNVLRPYVAERASTAPSRVGELMGLIDLGEWHKSCDKSRGVKSGTTLADLERITDRRNAIAHTGDRAGRGRAQIDLAYVTSEVQMLEDIVRCLAALTSGE